MAKRFLCGLVLGMAAIAPGVSAGVMMVAFGLYREILQALGELMRFRRIRQNLVFLLPLGLGALVSLPLLGLGLETLMERHPSYTLYAFAGLVLGGLPQLWRVIKSARPRPFHGLLGLLAFGAVFLLSRVGGSVLQLDAGFLSMVFCGLILALGTIVPGISSSFLLIYFGVYPAVIHGISHLVLQTVLPLALGFVLGAAILIRVVDRLLERRPAASYAIILGFSLGSMAAVLSPVPWAQMPVTALCLLLGLALGYGLSRLPQGTE